MSRLLQMKDGRCQDCDIWQMNYVKIITNERWKMSRLWQMKDERCPDWLKDDTWPQMTRQCGNTFTVSECGSVAPLVLYGWAGYEICIESSFVLTSSHAYPRTVVTLCSISLSHAHAHSQDSDSSRAGSIARYSVGLSCHLLEGGDVVRDCLPHRRPE